jgi:hypothetical protein
MLAIGAACVGMPAAKRRRQSGPVQPAGADGTLNGVPLSNVRRVDLAKEGVWRA